jgi:dihydroorotate dehydrogenase electron transfer subunit
MNDVIAPTIAQREAYAPGRAQLGLPTAFRIVEITQDNYRTKTLVLDGELDAVPGQFVMAWLPRFDEKPFSLVSAAPIALMITAVGPFTHLVHSLDVGDRLWLRGAFGRGFSPASTGARIALVAGGYGVAPLYWLAHSRLAHVEGGERSPAHMTAILGAREARELLYADRFARLLRRDAGNGGGEELSNRLILTTDDGTLGLHGRVTDALAPLLTQNEIDTVYACGPDAMLVAVSDVCRDADVAAELSWEAYMRCGVGLCGSCEHSGRLLCMDGPVLPL